jgi:hypothetical protein
MTKTDDDDDDTCTAQLSLLLSGADPTIFEFTATTPAL